MSIIYAVGGGNALNNEILTIEEDIFKGKDNPNVLFIPAASNDSDKNIESFLEHYKQYSKNINVLYLATKDYSFEEIVSYFNNADIVYVGGGRTERLMEVLYNTEVFELLKSFLIKDKVYVGVSAGAIILYEYGFGDANSYTYNGETFGYGLTKGLGILKGVFCPHYFSEGIMVFNEVIKTTNLDGYAVSNGASLKITNDNLSVIKEKGASAFVLRKSNNYILESLK